MKPKLSALDQACYFCLFAPAIGLGLFLALILSHSSQQAAQLYITALPLAYLLGGIPAFLTGLLSGRLRELRAKSLWVAAIGALFCTLTLLFLVGTTRLTTTSLPDSLILFALIGFASAFIVYWLVRRLPALNL